MPKKRRHSRSFGSWRYTGVKEQVAGSYAERLSESGFVTLALDHRHFGESEENQGEHEDLLKKMEDFKNALSFHVHIEGYQPGIDYQ